MKKLLLLSTLQSFAEKFEEIIGDLSHKKVVCITTAAVGEGSPEWMPREMAPLKDHVKSFIEYDLNSKSVDEVRETLSDADIIYVMGGNTYYLLEHVQKSGFKEVVEEKLAQGVFYIGASAGAALVCPSIDYIEDLDDPTKGNPDGFEALGLVDFFIMPHLDDPTFASNILKIMDKLMARNKLVVGIHENQGLLVNDNFCKVLNV